MPPGVTIGMKKEKSNQISSPPEDGQKKVVPLRNAKNMSNVAALGL